MQGLIVPTVTPMDARGERLDLGALERHCDFLAAAGADALFVAGTSGEAALLSAEERREVARVAVTAAGGRVPVVVHAGAPGTLETIGLARHARSVGAAAVAAVTPYYFPYGQDDLIEHYRALCEALEGFPVYAYTIPQLAANDLTALTLARLAEQPNLKGIKDSSGNLTKLLEYRRVPGLEVFIGSDQLALAFLRAGGDGLVSGPGGVMPELFAAFVRAHGTRDAARAEALHALCWELSDLLLRGARMDYLKAGVTWRGFGAGGARAPLPTLDAGARRELERRLDGFATRAERAGVTLLEAVAR